jgi:hypothetical protein
MTETTINTLDPETQVIVLEQTILSVEKLIAKRDKWLNDSKNKSRLIYKAIAIDTNEMRDKLVELQDKLRETKLKNK